MPRITVMNPAWPKRVEFAIDGFEVTFTFYNEEQCKNFKTMIAAITPGDLSQLQEQVAKLEIK